MEAKDLILYNGAESHGEDVPDMHEEVCPELTLGIQVHMKATCHML